jgi:hypothetical protein
VNVVEVGSVNTDMNPANSPFSDGQKAVNDPDTYSEGAQAELVHPGRGDTVAICIRNY